MNEKQHSQNPQKKLAVHEFSMLIGAPIYAFGLFYLKNAICKIWPILLVKLPHNIFDYKVM